MASSNFNIRIDDNLRAEVTQILAGYGLSPTQAIKLFFNQVVATRKVPLSFDFQAYHSTEPQFTTKVLHAIEQNQQEKLQGKSTIYTDLNEMMADLAK